MIRPLHANTHRRATKMLKNTAFALAMIFTIVASDYIGRNGWSDWLGIPLAAIMTYMVFNVIRAYYKGVK